MREEIKCDLTADLAICDTATEGPWEYVETSFDFDEITDADGKAVIDIGGYLEEDARFIAEARTGWPHAIKRAMLAEIATDILRHDLRKARAENYALILSKTQVEVENDRLHTLLDEILDDHDCSLSTRDLIEEALKFAES